MPEPFIDSPQMVGEWDPDGGGWSARDWAPGPAGTVGLSLRGDVELEIDVASPGTFVGLWVGADGAGSTGGVETVVALLGELRAHELLGMTGEARTWPLPGSDELRQRRMRDPRLGSLPGPDPGVAPALGRLGLALAVVEGATTSELARGLAAVDAALAADEVGGLGLDERAREAALLGAAVLLDRHSALDDVDVRALVPALRRLRRLLPDDMARGVRALARDLRDSDPSDALEVAFSRDLPEDWRPASIERRSMAEGALASAPVPVERLQPVTVPDRLSTAVVAARVTRDSEAEVRIHRLAGDADQWWARAFDADGAIVAAAPFLPSGADALARLLVPPSILHRATFDITDRPGEPRLPERMRSVVDAVHHGQDAARAERLDMTMEARRRWTEAERAWEAAGDESRANRARAFARDAPRLKNNRIPEPLLADAVLEDDG